jgi:N-sulfoglucosamine sulfohydrolase
MESRLQHLSLCFLILIFASSSLEAQPRSGPTAPIQDEPNLPRVLLIGDSISIGYTLPVREILKGRANVHRIPENGGPSSKGVQKLDQWLGNEKWDLIHFNWGLHDLKFMENGKRQVSLDDYEQNLTEIVNRLKQTGASLIWASTTPVPHGNLKPLRKPGDDLIYNLVAARIMQDKQVAVNDLYTLANSQLDQIQRPENVHFTPNGSRLLAEQVSSIISTTLTQIEKNRPQNSNPPNFVIFIADDHGENDLGCYGNKQIRTPNIDQLAAEGMRFTNAFLSISSCSPSRSSILTGRYPHNTGAEDLHMPLPANQYTIARYLKNAGYYCASVGKWHLGNPEKRNWSQVTECQAEVMAESTIESLRNRDREKPFLFWVASIDPHRSYQEGAVEPPHSPDSVRVPPYLPDHPKIRKELALYYDEVSRFDEHIGQIMTELESQNALENTVIIYVSDNGMPFPRAKCTLYDSGIHTPLIVRWPKNIPAGSVQTGLASSIDITPTLMALAGIPQDTMEGENITAMLRDPNTKLRERIYAEANWHDFEKFTRSVRSNQFKLIRNYYWDTPLWNSVDSVNSITWHGMLESKNAGKLTPSQSFLFNPERPYEEFFDLDADPFEQVNLVADPHYQRILNGLRADLDNWRAETHDVMPDQRRPDGWTRRGNPLPHNQPWYDRFIEQGGKNNFDKF